MKTEEAHRVRLLASTAKESIEQFGSVEGMDAYLTYLKKKRFRFWIIFLRRMHWYF